MTSYLVPIATDSHNFASQCVKGICVQQLKTAGANENRLEKLQENLGAGRGLHPFHLPLYVRGLREHEARRRPRQREVIKTLINGNWLSS